VVRSQLVWVDRTGKKLATVGELADLGNLELSPDNKRVAVAVLNETTGTRDLWLYDLATGGRMRLDSNVVDENWLVARWPPGGVQFTACARPRFVSNLVPGQRSSGTAGSRR
jgi:hypothetical protein